VCCLHAYRVNMPPPQPSTRALRSRSANVQPDNSELFDLDNISGSTADDEPLVPCTHHNRTENEPTIAQIINNPDPIPASTLIFSDIR
jgi:hypothetical protein